MIMRLAVNLEKIFKLNHVLERVEPNPCPWSLIYSYFCLFNKNKTHWKKTGICWMTKLMCLRSNLWISLESFHACMESQENSKQSIIWTYQQVFLLELVHFSIDMIHVYIIFFLRFVLGVVGLIIYSDSFQYIFLYFNCLSFFFFNSSLFTMYTFLIISNFDSEQCIWSKSRQLTAAEDLRCHCCSQYCDQLCWSGDYTEPLSGAEGIPWVPGGLPGRTSGWWWDCRTYAGTCTLYIIVSIMVINIWIPWNMWCYISGILPSWYNIPEILSFQIPSVGCLKEHF